jgi:hypothetical protein
VWKLPRLRAHERFLPSARGRENNGHQAKWRDAHKDEFFTSARGSFPAIIEMDFVDSAFICSFHAQDKKQSGGPILSGMNDYKMENFINLIYN